MKNLFTITTLLLILIFSACKKDDDSDPNKNLVLNISGLEDLGSSYIYEGWIIVSGAPVSSGTFSVDANGNLSKTSFSINATDLENTTTFILTIEPVPDNDPGPSDVHILAGDFSSTSSSSSSASLSVGHGAAVGDDFSSSAGTYILATPTSETDEDEYSGLWFLDNSSGSPVAGLTLPTLPAGWKYEGWTVIDGQPVTTGTFTVVGMADEDAPFSGPNSGPPFPGEDYIVNAPTGLSFPTDIRGGTAVISIEPDPDNSDAPFTLKPLVKGIAADAMVHTAYGMDQNLGSFPSGTASK